MRSWNLRAGAILLAVALVAALLGALSRGGHDPNRGIDREKARAAAGRVHTPPDPRVETGPGHGG